MLIVACRLMTSGVKGVSLLGSSVFRFCNKSPQLSREPVFNKVQYDSLAAAGSKMSSTTTHLLPQSAFLAHFVSMHCRDHCGAEARQSAKVGVPTDARLA